MNANKGQLAGIALILTGKAGRLTPAQLQEHYDAKTGIDKLAMANVVLGALVLAGFGEGIVFDDELGTTGMARYGELHAAATG